MIFEHKYNQLVSTVNTALEFFLPERDCPEGNLYKAMKYSLSAGGKRLRPVLSLAVCEMFDEDYKIVLPYACAIEMIHTYSLIHDDLPAMDNDDYRRGKPTNHKIFGEAMAILAGDALLNYAFEIMIQDALKGNLHLDRKTRAMAIISNSSGASGMVGGQVVDIESEGKVISTELLSYMHNKKTGALIKAPILSAAALCNASKEEFSLLEQYAEKVGLAFQIKDDILDLKGNFQDMGKLTGNDAANSKQTFVTQYGIEKAEEILEKTAQDARSSIQKLKLDSKFLEELIDYIVVRNK